MRSACAPLHQANFQEANGCKMDKMDMSQPRLNSLQAASWPYGANDARGGFKPLALPAVAAAVYVLAQSSRRGSPEKLRKLDLLAILRRDGM
jgi:hypothetical protein